MVFDVERVIVDPVRLVETERTVRSFWRSSGISGARRSLALQPQV